MVAFGVDGIVEDRWNLVVGTYEPLKIKFKIIMIYFHRIKCLPKLEDIYTAHP